MSQAQAIIQGAISCSDDTYIVSQILPPLTTVLLFGVVVWKSRDPIVLKAAKELISP